MKYSSRVTSHLCLHVMYKSTFISIPLIFTNSLRRSESLLSDILKLKASKNTHVVIIRPYEALIIYSLHVMIWQWVIKEEANNMRPLDDNMDMCYLSLISGRSSISALKFLTHCSMCIQNLKSHLRHCHFYPFLWFIGIREETVQYIYTMIIMQQYHGFYSFLCLIRTILNAI